MKKPISLHEKIARENALKKELRSEAPKLRRMLSFHEGKVEALRRALHKNSRLQAELSVPIARRHILIKKE